MQRPNILILYTDQQRWDALGANGNAEIRTPHLDRLAAAGVNFDHCFVQNPVCMPSRVSFLTGQYPSTLGLSHMGVPVPADAPTLPRLLRNYGYCSGQIGKLHFLPHANRDHRQPHPDYGFDHLEISDEPGSYHDAYRAWVAAQAPEQLDHVSLGEAPSSIEWKRIMNVRDGIAHPEERFVKRALASRCRSELTHTAFVAEQTMEFLTRHRDGPFLCIAGFYSPHDPWVAPQEFLDLYDPAALTLPPSHRPSPPAEAHSTFPTTNCAPPATAITPWYPRSITTSAASSTGSTLSALRTIPSSSSRPTTANGSANICATARATPGTMRSRGSPC